MPMNTARSRTVLILFNFKNFIILTKYDQLRIGLGEVLLIKYIHSTEKLQGKRNRKPRPDPWLLKTCEPKLTSFEDETKIKREIRIREVGWLRRCLLGSSSQPQQQEWTGQHISSGQHPKST